jgi:alanine racemase
VGVSRASAYVELSAIERNSERMRAAAPGAKLCAVVKANGYGHGAVPVARAALAGGAEWLAVASAEEAAELREAGLREVPILVMGALTPVELTRALELGVDVAVWHERSVEAVAAAGGGRVHVKLDTGMGRLGTRSATEAARVAEAAERAPGVELAGVMTHFATADQLDDDGFFAAQLAAFEAFAQALRRRYPRLLVHAANSAATLREPRAHFDMVRCGIALYGMDPFGADAPAWGLAAAFELRSYVAEVKLCRQGESVGYGRRFIAARDTWIGVLPLGYGDGFRRALSENADVLIGGRRFPVVGTVSMDNVTVDLGPSAASEQFLGREATILGAQGGERISAEELAWRLGTINYELSCGITARVPRIYTREGESRSERSRQPAAAGKQKRE